MPAICDFTSLGQRAACSSIRGLYRDGNLRTSALTHLSLTIWPGASDPR